MSDEKALEGAARGSPEERLAMAGLIDPLLWYLYSSGDGADQPGKHGECNCCGQPAFIDRDLRWDCDHASGCAVGDAERFAAEAHKQPAAGPSSAPPENQLGGKGGGK